jgi:hypothetical protein
MDDKNVRALTAFGLWSNYLLVTTVAAVGWISSKSVTFTSPWMQSTALWCLSTSAIFGILALAIVPLVSEQMRPQDESIFVVQAAFSILGLSYRAYLTQACRPQHILFMLGIVFYAWGTTKGEWIGIPIAVAAVVYSLFSVPHDAPRSRVTLARRRRSTN